MNFFGCRIDLQTILKKLVSKVDDKFSPTSNQINVCLDYVACGRLNGSPSTLKQNWMLSLWMKMTMVKGQLTKAARPEST